MALSADTISRAYVAACRAEIAALKPGNVHIFADGHRMSATQFLLSAAVSAAPLTAAGETVGRRILGAVRATRDTVATNTNLGIVLLAAPLAAAAEASGPLRANLAAVLGALTLADADDAFRAILLAEPGGLGEAARHDVNRQADAPLGEAMREATPRDLIARQYVTEYKDVFDIGLPALRSARAAGGTGMWPTIAAYMAFLVSFPDSHVARRHGLEHALSLRAEAVEVAERLAAADEAERLALLTAFDGSLKARGINPGTCADLTVASLFVDNLVAELA